MTSARFTAGLAVLWILFTAGVYLPDIGRGFVKDDFGWVAAAQQIAPRPLSAFTEDRSGTFYRPLVTLSFLGDFTAYRLNARGYGFTNLALFVVCVALVLLMLEATGLPREAAAVGTFAWAINPSGPDMAVLWLSGRTALLMIAFSLVSLLLWRRNQRIAAALSFFLALLCKEEAISVPLIACALDLALDRDRFWRRLPTTAVLFGLPLGAYFALRAPTHAITPANAPDYYRLTWNPLTIAINTAHYLDRAGTIMAVVALFALLACRVRPRFERDDRRRLLFGLGWFALALVITVRVPVRSTLYALFPSVGMALMLATFVQALRRSTAPAEGRRPLLAMLAIVLLLIPAYNVRNDRWSEAARVSTRTLNTVVPQLAGAPRTGTIALVDEPQPFSNFGAAFGDAATEAMRLFTGRDWSAVVVPADHRDPLPDEVARYQLVHGRVTRVVSGHARVD
jgi:hypothetical protein